MPDVQPEYTEPDIRLIKFSEGIRLRPSMYIGSTDQWGLHHLIEELLENAVNAHRYGNATRIDISLHDDGSVTVDHNGDGVSVEPEPAFKGRSYLEFAFTDWVGGGGTIKAAYNHHSMHYVGICTVPPLSDFCEVESRIDGQAYRMRFQQGKIVEPLACRGSTVKTGLTVRFRPDPAIFKAARVDPLELRRRVRELAALVPNLKFIFHDETLGHDDEFHFPDGSLVLLQDLLPSQGTILAQPLRVQAQANGIRLDFAAQYVGDGTTHVASFVNLGPTRQQGTHVRGCLLGLQAAIQGFSAVPQRDRETKLSLRRIQSGLRAVIAVDMPGAHFEGPTKEKLANQDIERWCQDSVAIGVSYDRERSCEDWTRLLTYLEKLEG